MKITKHGQSCLLVETKSGKILIDPGSFVFNEEGLSADKFMDIDVMLFTHEHSDHFDIENVKKIIDANKSKVIACATVCDALKQENIEINIVEAEVGKSYDFDDFSVKVYKSTHGPLPTGAEPPEVIGFKIEENGEKSMYSPGDTIELAETGADLIAVPICGQVVLSIKEAKAELIEQKPEIAIPIHYDNPRFPVDVRDFVEAMKDTNVEVKALGWCESIVI